MIVTSLTINSGAVALANGLHKNEVPKIKKNTANLLAFLLAEEDIDLVNSFFQSVHLVFHRTAPIWS